MSLLPEYFFKLYTNLKFDAKDKNYYKIIMIKITQMKIIKYPNKNFTINNLKKKL